VNPVIMQAQSHGLPALEAFAPPLISPLCCFNLNSIQREEDEPARKIGGDSDICFDGFGRGENEINRPGFGFGNL
jgi:hypothetical protein